VCLLAPHLTEANVDSLVAGAVHRSKTEIEAWLARQCAPATGSESGAVAAVPRARVRVIAVRSTAPAQDSAEAALPAVDPLFATSSLPPGAVNLHVAAPPVPAPAPAPATYLVQIPIDEDTHALLREVQGLLGHTIRPDDVGAVFRRALDGLRTELLKRKAGATTRPRKDAPRAAETRTRTIPAHVRRVVWTRDAGRCTFTSDAGRRCGATRALEYDHLVPFARGGETTVPGLRLRCRAHNQYEAERAFGAELMRRKREHARAGAVRPPGGP
jgi:5-methylcytosine-specific restriction endonuclease McrA